MTALGQLGSGRLAAMEETVRQYIAPDGGARVAVVSVGKETGLSDYESRVEFQSRHTKTACVLAYSSDASEHGFRVVRAEWTPDSHYFVYALTSSGGHQAWRAPTQSWSRNEAPVRSLDDYFAAKISRVQFRLVAPNTVTTEVWEGTSVPVTVSLAALPPIPFWRKSKPISVDCTGVQVFKPDQP